LSVVDLTDEVVMQTKPLKMLLVMLAGWINRQQHETIEYLKEENKILREKLGGKRILLTGSKRRRLAILGKRLGRELLGQVCWGWRQRLCDTFQSRSDNIPHTP